MTKPQPQAHITSGSYAHVHIDYHTHQVAFVVHKPERANIHTYNTAHAANNTQAQRPHNTQATATKGRTANMTTTAVPRRIATGQAQAPQRMDHTCDPNLLLGIARDRGWQDHSRHSTVPTVSSVFLLCAQVWMHWWTMSTTTASCTVSVELCATCSRGDATRTQLVRGLLGGFLVLRD